MRHSCHSQPWLRSRAQPARQSERRRKVLPPPVRRAGSRARARAAMAKAAPRTSRARMRGRGAAAKRTAARAGLSSRERVWTPWDQPAHRESRSGGTRSGVTAWRQGVWKAEPTLRRARAARMTGTGRLPHSRQAPTRAREKRPMAPSARAMMRRRSKWSATAPVKSPSTPWGSKAAMAARESTAAEPVRAVRSQTRAYWETELVRMDTACPTHKTANCRFHVTVMYGFLLSPRPGGPGGTAYYRSILCPGRSGGPRKHERPALPSAGRGGAGQKLRLRDGRLRLCGGRDGWKGGGTLYSFSPSAQAFSSATLRRPLSIRPSRIFAPGALGRRPAADLPRPLPPEVAKRTMVLPEKS